jgi:predicted transglutaminase-like cysteine proteinase
MASILKAIGRFLFGFKRYDNLNDYISSLETVTEAIDYAKQHFTYEPDTKPSDEWQLPDVAFKALQSPNTGSDCDDYAVVFHAFCQAKGIPSWLVAVWRKGDGHAICVAEINQMLVILDNFYRPMWRYASIVDVCKEVYSDAIKANYVIYDNKCQKYVYGEKII